MNFPHNPPAPETFIPDALDSTNTSTSTKMAKADQATKATKTTPA
jgi:hypothetical protein